MRDLFQPVSFASRIAKNAEDVQERLPPLQESAQFFAVSDSDIIAGGLDQRLNDFVAPVLWFYFLQGDSDCLGWAAPVFEEYSIDLVDDGFLCLFVLGITADCDIWHRNPSFRTAEAVSFLCSLARRSTYCQEVARSISQRRK